MIIKEAKFIKSSSKIEECPKSHFPEYVFLGRSNVGKSSLINMLVNRNKLSKTSSKPGKTQLINHFLINNSLFFVDLPGYGWAKTSKKNRESWDLMTKKYLLNSNKIVLIFILIDIRLRPQKIDIDIIFYNQLILNTHNLTIPHPRACERDFVLLPVCNLVPFFRHPVYKLSIKDLVKKLKNNYLIKKLSNTHFR